MSEARPSLFARLSGKLDPRLSFGLIGSSIYFTIFAIFNIFAAYNSAVEPNFNSLSVHLFAVLVYTVPAVGILRLNRWARLFGIFLTCFAVFMGILAVLVANPGSDQIFGIFDIVAPAAVLFCLLSRKTRAIFATQLP